jgi:hypothetical protein
MRSKSLFLLALMVVTIGLGGLVLIRFIPESSTSQVATDSRLPKESPSAVSLGLASQASLSVPKTEVGTGIGGLILEADGGPAAGAEVWAYSVDEPRDFGTATSGPDGAFHIGGLAHMKYWAVAKLEDRTAIEQASPTASENRFTLAARARLQVRVVDLDGALVPDARIELSIQEKRLAREIAGELVSILNDTPALVEPGVFVCALGLRSLYQMSANSRSRGTGLKKDLALVAGGVTTMAEITVLSGQPVSGRVVDSLSRPIENAWIVLAALDEAEGKKLHAAGLTNAETDTGGNFRVGPVPPGLYRLRAEKMNFAPSELSPVEVYPMRPTGAVEIVLLEGGSISVRYLEDGQPVIDGVRVHAASQEITRSPNLDDVGGFIFYNLPPGPYLIVATPPDQEGKQVGLSKGVELENGEHLEIVFDADEVIRLTGILHGFVSSDQALVRLRMPGGPVPPVVPSAYRQTTSGVEGIVAEGGVRPDGKFELMVASTGSYLLEVFHVLGDPTQEQLDAAVPVITMPITIGGAGIELNLTLP